MRADPREAQGLPGAHSAFVRGRLNEKERQVKNRSMWQRCKAQLTGTHAAMQDTPVGEKEGLHEARALKDYRVHTFIARWSSDKAA